jgi:hypothetical protein
LRPLLTVVRLPLPPTALHPIPLIPSGPYQNLPYHCRWIYPSGVVAHAYQFSFFFTFSGFAIMVNAKSKFRNRFLAGCSCPCQFHAVVVAQRPSEQRRHAVSTARLLLCRGEAGLARSRCRLRRQKGLHRQRLFLHISLLVCFPFLSKTKAKKGRGEKRARETLRRQKKKKKTSVAFVLSFHALESSIILSSAYLLLFFCLVSDLSFLPSLLQEGTLARAYLFASLCYQAAHSGLLPAPFALNLSHRKNSLNCIYRNQERKKTLRRSTKQVSIRHRTSSIYLTCYIWHTQV